VSKSGYNFAAPQRFGYGESYVTGAAPEYYFPAADRPRSSTSDASGVIYAATASATTAPTATQGLHRTRPESKHSDGAYGLAVFVSLSSRKHLRSLLLIPDHIVPLCIFAAQQHKIVGHHTLNSFFLLRSTN